MRHVKLEDLEVNHLNARCKAERKHDGDYCSTCPADRTVDSDIACADEGGLKYVEDEPSGKYCSVIPGDGGRRNHR